MKFDLNCDLGEGEPESVTAELMRQVTSANIACGGHAGNRRTMEECLRLAKENRVLPGAHPGLKGAFGRGAGEVGAEAFRQLLAEQVGALRSVAESVGTPLHHVKLHGALYHLTEREGSFRRVYLDWAAEQGDGLVIYSLANGTVAAEARQRGLPVWEEAFLDRGYQPDGALVARGERGALLDSISEVVGRVRSLRDRGFLLACDGSVLPLTPQTLCLHSDTPRAVEIAQAARAALE